MKRRLATDSRIVGVFDIAGLVSLFSELAVLAEASAESACSYIDVDESLDRRMRHPESTFGTPFDALCAC